MSGAKALVRRNARQMISLLPWNLILKFFRSSQVISIQIGKIPQDAGSV
jgi:hypothetical protein